MDEQKILLEYEYYRAQVEELREAIEIINASIVELSVVTESLDTIKALKEKNEILVPIGSDSFVSARITDTKNVIVGLGAGVAAKKKIKEAKLYLENKKKKLEDIQDKNSERLQALAQRIQELSPQVERIVSRVQEGG